MKRTQDVYHKIHVKAKLTLVAVLWLLFILQRYLDGAEVASAATLVGLIICLVWVLGLNFIAYMYEDLAHCKHKHRKI